MRAGRSRAWVRLPARNRKANLSQFVSLGAVLRRHGHHLIAWTRDRTGTVLALHVAPQTGPRHRAHVPIPAAECVTLGIGAVTSIIDTAAPLVDVVGATVVGEAPIRLRERIATAIRRNAEAEAFEARWVPPWP